MPLLGTVSGPPWPAKQSAGKRAMLASKSMRLRWFSGADEPLELVVPAGERLLDLVDEHPGLSLPFACRAANCGTCLVRIRAGQPLVEPPGEWERIVLERVGAGPNTRLGCQLRINSDTSPEEEATADAVLTLERL
jgi:ferredoxin